MGTRNLTIVRKNGENKVFQYGQWDGYLSGQGKTVYTFCRNKKRLKKLESRLSKIQLGWNETQPEFTALREKDKIFNEPDNWKTWMDVYNNKEKYWVTNFTSRDICANILYNIINTDFKNDLPPEFNGKLFLKEYSTEKDWNNYHDLWIEYTYIIDFDTRKLEVWAYGDKIRDCSLDDLPNKETFFKED